MGEKLSVYSYHHIKDPWTLSKVMGGDVKSITLRHGTLTEA